MTSALVLAALNIILNLALSGFAQESIGVNLIGAAGTSGTLSSGSLAGVPGYAQVFWNNGSGNFSSLSGLVDNAGQITSASVQWSSITGLGDNGAIGTGDNYTLMRGFLNSAVPGNGVLFNGIPYPVYDVLIYMSGPPTSAQPGDLYYRSPDFSSSPPAVEGYSPRVLYSEAFSGSFVEATPSTAGNYYRFQGLTYKNLGVGSIFFPLNAVQIVSVPEPSSTIMVGLALACIAGCYRRKPGIKLHC